MRNFAKILIKSLFFLALTVNINSQEIPRLVSPDVASLARYGEFPTNLHNGTIDISIPIYTIKTKGLSLPISISYHSAGIKVNDFASSVGLGWSLNAGGMVTHRVIGESDEQSSGFIYKGQETITTLNNAYWHINNVYQMPDFNDVCLLYQEIINSRRDVYPDVFIYNFPGYAGKFMFSGESIDEIYTVPYEPLKIVYDGVKFEITDHSGTTFLFEEREYNVPPIGASWSKYVSTWRLTKITSANETETIELRYTPYTQTIFSSSQSAEVENCCSVVGGIQSPISAQEIESEMLSEIVFPNGKVVFEPLRDREDSYMGNSYRIKSITVLNENDEVIKKTEFEHSYFNPNSTNNAKRLKLTSVQFTDGANPLQPPYQLTYNESPSLKPLFSSNQDYWGYQNLNGANHLLPDLQNNPANREANEGQMKAGSIKKIIYPTGGSTVFTFGANEVTNGIGIPGGNNDYVERTISFSQTTICGEFPRQTHTINDIQGNVTIRVVFPDIPDDLYWGDIENNILLDMDGLSNSNNNTDLGFIIAGLKVQNVYAHSTEPGYNYFVGREILIEDIEVTNGTEISAFLGEVCDGDENTGFAYRPIVYITYLTTIPSDPNKVVGGLRIEKIENFDQNETLVNTKTYSYYDEEEHSTGHYTNTVRGKGLYNRTINYFLDGARTLHTSYDQANTGFDRDGFMGYGMVTEYNGTESDNVGKTEFYYSYQNDTYTGAGCINYPFCQRIDNSHVRGKLINTKYYKAGSSMPEKEVINNYSLVETNSINAAVIGSDFYDYTNTNCFVDFFTVNKYTVPLTWYRQDGTITKDYLQNGNSIDTEVNFEYSTNLPYLIKSITTNKSNGKTQKTLYIYSTDYLFGDCQNNFEQCADDRSIALEAALESNQNCMETQSENCYNLYQEYAGVARALRNREVECQNNCNGRIPCMSRCIDKYGSAAHRVYKIAVNEFENCLGNMTCTNYFNSLYNPNDYPCETDLETCNQTHYSNSDNITQTILKMQEKNIINIPIEEITLEYDDVNGSYKILFANLKKFSYKNDRIFLKQEYKLANPGATYDETFLSKINDIDNFEHNSNYDLKLIYDEYDEHGNLVQYHKKNDVDVVFIWGYNNSYPLAKIEGIKYNSVTSEAIAEIKKLETAGDNLSQINQNIRSLIPGTFITTYTHKPLIGMSTQADPNGYTMHYIYDNFGRLSVVKDDDENILKEYHYNYARSVEE